jgi:hypothetical protein
LSLYPGVEEAEVRLTAATNIIVSELDLEIGDPVENRRAAAERDNYKLVGCVGRYISSDICYARAFEFA